MSNTIPPVPASLRRWDVVGVGASCVDYVYRLPEFPAPAGARSKIRIRSGQVACGGQTATTLSTCSRLGLRAKYVGAIGRDEHGQWIRDALARHGVDTTDVVQRGESTASAVILIDDTGERLVLWHRDDGLVLPPDALPLDAIAQARLVHVDDVDEPAALRAASLARAAGIPVTCDIDHVTARTEDLLALVSLPVLAEHVPSALTGEADLERALRALRARHPGVICVTLGERGAVALEGDTLHRVPAFHVDAVDTTGAGDVFRGGFIHALLEGLSMPAALRFANAAAAASCTRLGALAGVPSLLEIKEILRAGRARA